MAVERSFVMVKPDGVRRGLIGEVIQRIERRGLKILAMKMLTAPQALAEEHYAAHREKSFFHGVVRFITSGPVVAMVVEGDAAIAALRQMMGATRPLEAAPGSLRADFALDVEQNIVHGSDSAATAAEEIRLWFGDELA